MEKRIFKERYRRLYKLLLSNENLNIPDSEIHFVDFICIAEREVYELITFQEPVYYSSQYRDFTVLWPWLEKELKKNAKLSSEFYTLRLLGKTTRLGSNFTWF